MKSARRALDGELLVPQPTLARLSRFRLDPDPHRAVMRRLFPTSAPWCARARRGPGASSTGDRTRSRRTLAAMGIGRADKIAILAANSVEYLETFMGGLRAGACVKPLSTMAAGRCAGEKMLDDLAMPRCCSCRNQYRALVEPHDDRLTKLVPGGSLAYDFLERPGWHDFEHWLADASDLAARAPARPARRLQHHLFVGHDRPAQGASCTPTPCATCRRCGLTAFDFAPKSISPSPRRRSTRTPPWSRCWGDAGCRRYDDPDAEVRHRGNFLEMRRARARDPCDAGAGPVPAHFPRILISTGNDLKSFMQAVAQARRCAPTIKADAVKRWPGRLIEIYGLTEGGGSCTLEANLHPDQAVQRWGGEGSAARCVVIDEQGRGAAPGRGRRAGRPAPRRR